MYIRAFDFGCSKMREWLALSLMKLSISTLVCPTWSWPQIVGAASAYGIHGIDPRGLGPEIDVTKLSTFDSELNSSMELLHRHGLDMPCLNTSIALVTAAPERWEMMLFECHRYARLAERSGANKSGEPEDVIFAITESGLRSEVHAGENQGETLAHAPVVRRLAILGEVNGTFDSKVRADLDPSWKREHVRYVAFVQGRRSRHILGAGYH